MEKRQIILFIISLILIFEVSFRLWQAPPKDENGKYLPSREYHFYPLQQDETDTVRWYVYHIFEHVKVIALCVIITIVFSRCSFLVWMFGLDLGVFLLNYYSSWMDFVKFAIFAIVSIKEALRYYHYHNAANGSRAGFDSGSDGHRDYSSYASIDGVKGSWTDEISSRVAIVKKVLSRNHHRSKA